MDPCGDRNASLTAEKGASIIALWVVVVVAVAVVVVVVMVVVVMVGVTGVVAAPTAGPVRFSRPFWNVRTDVHVPERGLRTLVGFDTLQRLVD